MLNFTRPKKAALVAFATLALSGGVQAQTLKLGSGAISGNYFSMMEDVDSYCSESLTEGTRLEVMATDGSVDNLVGMGTKTYSLGVVQEDVLQFFAKRDPRKVNENRIKVISGLHMESVHLIVPKNYSPDGWGGLLSSITGSKKMSIDQLKGQTIGSWGGSMISAKALSYFMGLDLDVREVPSKKRVDPGIPILLVGGHPYKPAQELLDTGKYVLIPIDYNQIKAQAQFYLPSSINYKVDGRIVDVSTFAVRALLVGKSFRKETRNENMKILAECISENLVDLADDPDTNPNWASVYEIEEQGEELSSWAYFPL
jgi:TRAP-type uncharacterized transport system substrate-binding protein